MTGMEFYGHVNTLEQFFSYGPDGQLRYRPWNRNYSTVHPDREPGTDMNSVAFTIRGGEYFQVMEELDKSEGRGGVRPAGNFMDDRGDGTEPGRHRRRSRQQPAPDGHQ